MRMYGGGDDEENPRFLRPMPTPGEAVRKSGTLGRPISKFKFENSSPGWEKDYKSSGT